MDKHLLRFTFICGAVGVLLAPFCFPSKITPNSRIFEKIIASQFTKKFPTFYGTRRFIVTFTGAHR
jgi:hypothetical protein